MPFDEQGNFIPSGGGIPINQPQPTKAELLASRKEEKARSLAGKIQTTPITGEFYDADTTAPWNTVEGYDKGIRIGDPTGLYPQAPEAPNTIRQKYHREPTKEELLGYQNSVMAKDNYLMDTQVTPRELEAYRQDTEPVPAEDWSMYEQAMRPLLRDVQAYATGVEGHQGTFGRPIRQVRLDETGQGESLQDRLLSTGVATEAWGIPAQQATPQALDREALYQQNLAKLKAEAPVESSIGNAAAGFAYTLGEGLANTVDLLAEAGEYAITDKAWKDVEGLYGKEESEAFKEWLEYDDRVVNELGQEAVAAAKDAYENGNYWGVVETLGKGLTTPELVSTSLGYVAGMLLPGTVGAKAVQAASKVGKTAKALEKSKGLSKAEAIKEAEDRAGTGYKIVKIIAGNTGFVAEAEQFGRDAEVLYAETYGEEMPTAQKVLVRPLGLLYAKMDALTAKAILLGKDPVAKAIPDLVKQLPNQMKATFAGKIATLTGATTARVAGAFAVEGGTEAVQTAMEQVAGRYKEGEKGVGDVLNEQAYDIAGAGILGAAGGAQMAAPGIAAGAVPEAQNLIGRLEAEIARRREAKTTTESTVPQSEEATPEEREFVNANLKKMIDDIQSTGTVSGDLNEMLNNVYIMGDIVKRVGDSEAAADVKHNLGVVRKHILDSIENAEEPETIKFGSAEKAIDAIDEIMSSTAKEQMTGKLVDNLKKIALANGVSEERFNKIRDEYSVQEEAELGPRGYATYLRAARAYASMDNPDQKAVNRLVRDAQNFYDIEVDYQKRLEEGIKEAQDKIRTANEAKSEGLPYKLSSSDKKIKVEIPVGVRKTPTSFTIYIKEDENGNYYIEETAERRLQQKIANAAGAKAALDELGVELRTTGKIRPQDVGIETGVLIPEAASGPKADRINAARDKYRKFLENKNVNKVILSNQPTGTVWDKYYREPNKDVVNTAKYNKSDVVLVHTNKTTAKTIEPEVIKAVVAAKKAGATIVVDPQMSEESKIAVRSALKIGVKYGNVQEGTKEAYTYKPAEEAEAVNEVTRKTKEEKAQAAQAKVARQLAYIEAVAKGDVAEVASTRKELLKDFESVKDKSTISEKVKTVALKKKKDVIDEVVNALELQERLINSTRAEDNKKADVVTSTLKKKYGAYPTLWKEAETVYNEQAKTADRYEDILSLWKNVESAKIEYGERSAELAEAESKLGVALDAIGEQSVMRDVFNSSVAKGLTPVYNYEEETVIESKGLTKTKTHTKISTKAPDNVSFKEVPRDVSSYTDVKGTTILNTLDVKYMSDTIKEYSTGLMEAFTNVIPTSKEIGSDKGTKAFSKADYALIDSPARGLLFSTVGDVEVANENVVLALGIALKEQIAHNGYMLSNKPKSAKDVAQMLGIDEHAVNYKVKAYVNELGMLNKTLAHNLGKSVATLLGIGRKSNVDVDEQAYDRLLTDLGNTAVLVGIEMGLLEKQTKPAVEYAKVVLGKSSKEIADTAATVDFVRVAEDSAIDYAKDVFESIKEQMPDIDINRREPQSVKISKQRKDARTSVIAKSKSGFVPAQKARDALNKLMDIEWSADLARIQDVVANRDAIAKLEGYKDLDKLPDEMSYEQREVQSAINQAIDKTFDELEKLLQRAEEEGADGAMSLFYEWYYTKNGRYMMDSNTINPQTDKIVRFLVQPADHTLEYEVKKTDESTEFTYEGKDVTSLVEYTIAQAFGYKVDKKATSGIKEFAQAMLKVEDLESLRKDILENGEAEVTVGGVVYVAEAEHITHALQAIDFMEQAKKGKVTSALTAEFDAVTSGFGLKLLQMPIIGNVVKYLVKVGVIPGKVVEGMDTATKAYIENPDSVVSMNDFLGSGVLDSYQELASKIVGINTEYVKDSYGEALENKQINEIKGFTGKSTDAVWDKVSKILPQYTVGEAISSQLRTLFKDPFMTFNYSASIRSIKNSLAGVLVNDTIVPSILKAEKGTDAYALAEQIVSSLKSYNSVKELQEALRNEPLHQIKTGFGVSLEQYLHTLMFVSYGAKVEEIMSSEFSEFMQAQDVINDSFKAMFQAYKVKYDATINDVRTKNGKVTLEDKKKVIDDLKKYFPGIRSPLAELEDGEPDVGIYKERTATPDSESVGVKPAQTYYKDGDKVSSSTVWHMIKEFEAAMSAGSVVPIHYIDGSIMGEMLTEVDSGITAIHDAVMPPLVKAGDTQKKYNEKVFNISKRYSVIESIKNAVDKALEYTKDDAAFNEKVEVYDRDTKQTELVSIKEYISNVSSKIDRLNSKVVEGRTKLFGMLENTGATIAHMAGTPEGIYRVNPKAKTAKSAEYLEDEDVVAQIEGKAMSDAQYAKNKAYVDKYISMLGLRIENAEYSEYLAEEDPKVIRLKRRNDPKEEMAILMHEVKHAITYKTIVDNSNNTTIKEALKEIETAIMRHSDKFTEHTLDRLNYAYQQNGTVAKMAEVVAILSTEQTVRDDFLKVTKNRFVETVLQFFRRLLNNPELFIDGGVVKIVDDIVKDSRLKASKETRRAVKAEANKEKAIIVRTQATVNQSILDKLRKCLNG